MIKHRLAAILLASTTAAALAADVTPYYAGADLGTSQFDGQSDHLSSYGVLAGYQLNPYVGFELSLRRLGDVYVYTPTSVTKGNLNQSALSVIGTLPLNARWGVLGRYGRVQLKQHGNNIDPSMGNGALFGLGVQYTHTAAWAARLEAQRPASGISNFSASLLYTF
ncbi:outer membrane beta-barrel protein [Massilia sp. PWRC2]|uniref:outer membrane beta-barrel protein n=1 Tax=Massilia sp. PWRC2 TaxID=2804626 RepID=UPI003CF29F9A